MTNIIKLDHELIAKKYIDEHNRVVDIADEFEVSPSVIKRHLEEVNIKMRKKGYGFNILPIKQPTQQQYEFFDGLMVSDGSIPRKKLSKHRKTLGNNKLSCAFKYEEFAYYIKSELDLGKEVYRKIHKSERYKSGECITYSIDSSANILFTQERSRWYPEGKKIIPDDFRFSPISMNIAYLGDGSRHIHRDAKHKNSKTSLCLCTDSFTKENLEDTLVKWLNDINISCWVTKANRIYISTKSAEDFIDYIGPCPVNCYNYKWEL